MADTATGFPRDRRGEWVPGDLPGPSPVFSRPWRVKQVLKSLFGLEGLLGWQAMIYTGLCVVAWLFFTPEMARMRTFGLSWIAEIYLRNAALLLLVAGSIHLRLYVLKSQGERYKFNSHFPHAGNRKFLFGSQTCDNVFYNFVSGVTTWTAFEAVSMWAYANGWLPFVEFAPTRCTAW